MSRGKKIALGLVLALILIVVALVVLVPMLIDVDRYRPELVARIQQEAGRPAEIGHLAATIFPQISIRVDDVQLGNPPGFPRDYFVKAHRVYAILNAGALWNRQVQITSLELDDPSIKLFSDVRGKWNYENPVKSPAVKPAAAAEKPLVSLGTISKVKLRGGQLSVANLLASGEPGPAYFQGQGISIDLDQVDLNAFTAASFPISSRPHRPLIAALEDMGITSVAYAAEPPVHPAARGTFKADSLRFATLGITSVKTGLRLFTKRVFLDNLSFDCYRGHGTGDLSFDSSGANPKYTANAKLQGVDVAKFLEAFPDAQGKITGTLDGDIKLAGEVSHSADPLAGMRGTGHMSVRKGQLPSLQLNANILKLARLANLAMAKGDPSSFSSISADLNIANGRISSNNITIIGNGVDIDAAGSLAVAGQGNLDYNGNAHITAEKNALTNVLASLSGASFDNGKLSFPFGLGGSFSEPRFTLKSLAGPGGKLGAVQGALGAASGQQATQAGQQQNPAELVKGIAGLVKKKKAAPAPQPATQPNK